MRFLEQNFECSGCGRCCRDWKVCVNAQCRDLVRRSALEEAIVAETGGPGMVIGPGGDLSTARPHGDCVYLSPNNRCRIHESLGGVNKPLGCQQFPFLPVNTPDGLVVGVSFYCPAIQTNVGPSLASYQAELKELLQRQPVPTQTAQVVVTGGVTMPWAEYLEIETILQQREGPALASAVARLVYALAGPNPQAWRDIGEPKDPILELLHQTFLANFIDLLEEAQGRLITQFQADQPVYFSSLGLEVALGDLQSYGQRYDLPWFHAQLSRYLNALLFRKLLVMPPGLVENLLAFSLLPSVIVTYTYASAMARGEAPVLADFFLAVDRCERSLITHSRESYVVTASYLDFVQKRLARLTS